MKVLIIWGGWIGHNPEETAGNLKTILEEKGHEVVTTCDFSILLNTNLEQYDVIVPIWSCGIKGDVYMNALLTAIRNGVGFAAFHGGINWFEDEKYFEMLGAFYLNDTDYEEFFIHIKDKNHIITKNTPDYKSKGEVYNLQYDLSNEIIADVQVNNVLHPYAWIKNYGKGKVFYSMGAHELKDLFHEPCRNILVNGILWCGDKEHRLNY